MKLKLILVFICVMSMTTNKIWSDPIKTKINGIYYDIYKDDGYAEVTPVRQKTQYTDATPNTTCSGDIVIPDSISYGSNTYPVTSINQYSFFGNDNITSVIIGDNVTTIGEDAFSGCDQLESVIIGNGVKALYDSFQYCDKLTTVTLGKSLEKMSEESFIGGSPFHKSPITLVISLIDRLFKLQQTSFDEEVYINGQLLVPLGQAKKYRSAGWGRFFSIQERDFLTKHNLTYVVDGIVYEKYELGYNEATIIPEEEPSKEGYSFSGWSEIPKLMPANDVNITGMMIPQKYQATFIVDGETYSTTEVDYGSSITLPEMPEKEGYTFSWIDVPATMPAHDITIRGYYTVNQYNLTYYVDGQKYKTFELDYGTVITPEERLEKEGYTFYGWSDIPATMPAHDVSVTGRFVVNQYQITYMVDFTIFYSEMLDFGATITPPEVPNKEGYDFSWSDIPDKMPAHNLTIHGFYTSGILSILMDNSKISIYQTNGRKTKKLRHGVNIIKDSNGKIKKVIHN